MKVTANLPFNSPLKSEMFLGSGRGPAVSSGLGFSKVIWVRPAALYRRSQGPVPAGRGVSRCQASRLQRRLSRIGFLRQRPWQQHAYWRIRRVGTGGGRGANYPAGHRFRAALRGKDAAAHRETADQLDAGVNPPNLVEALSRGPFGWMVTALWPRIAL